MKQGKDLNQFVSAMIEVYRDILILRMVKENHSTLIDASKEYIESINDIAVNLTPNHLSRALDQLIDLSKALKYAQNKRALFEATLIKMVYPETEISYSSLIERVERLEAKMASDSRQNPAIYQGTNISNQPPQKPIVTNQVPQPQTSQTQTAHVQQTQPLPQTQPQENLQGAMDQKPAEDEIESFIEFTDNEITLENIQSQWDTFIEIVSSEKKGLIPLLQGSKPIKLNHTKCHVALLPESKLFTAMLGNTINSEYLNAQISKLVKKLITLEYDIIESTQEPIDKEAQLKNYFKDYKNVLEIK